MHKTLRLVAVAASLVLAAGGASAELLFGAPAGAQTISFDDAASYDTSVSAVQIGASVGTGVTVAALGGTLQFGAPYGAWTLSSNGEWTGASFVGVDGAFQDETAGIAASLVFDFALPQSAVGAVLNFDPDFTYGGGLPLPLYLAAYDATGTLIEEHFVPVSTPGALNAGVFYGIGSLGSAIARFEVSGPYAVVDTLAMAPVPEPAAVGSLLAGLAVLGAALRRRRAV